ncbi:MAG: hypothetical protein NTZ27_12485 [Ignavibacteriales bacterium]|nr:hypothetical protein [Ignavibacteriales bacterium]
MKLYKKFMMAAVLCCLMILLESCSSSSLVDVWNDPTYHESPLKKILIIAIRKDPVQRRIWEDAFVGELSKHGVQSTSSYHLFPDVLPDTNQIIQTVQEKGFDGILVTRLLLAETETHYVQSYVTTEQISRYNIFRKRYDTYYHNIQHPGYVESQIIDRRAIDVWVIRNEERMIWSATSNSPERNTVEDVQNDIAELVIPELTRNAIIKSGK